MPQLPEVEAAVTPPPVPPPPPTPLPPPNLTSETKDSPSEELRNCVKDEQKSLTSVKIVLLFHLCNSAYQLDTEPV